MPGDVPSSLIGTHGNRTTKDGRWYTTKSNPYFGKMKQPEAEEAAARDAAKLLTDGGFVTLRGEPRTLYTNDTYYVDIRVVGKSVSYEIGPVLRSGKQHSATSGQGS
jgi:hypothetical protein